MPVGRTGSDAGSHRSRRIPPPQYGAGAPWRRCTTTSRRYAAFHCRERASRSSGRQSISLLRYIGALGSAKPTFRVRRDGFEIDHLTNGLRSHLLDPNGAGTAPAIHTLLGLIEPTSGSRRSFGKSLERDRICLVRVETR